MPGWEVDLLLGEVEEPEPDGPRESPFSQAPAWLTELEEVI